MTNIGKIIGGGRSFVNGGMNSRPENEAKEAKAQEQVVNNYNETQVDADVIFNHLSNNIFVGSLEAPRAKELAPDVIDRVTISVQDFEAFFNTARYEIGEDLALELVNLYLK